MNFSSQKNQVLKFYLKDRIGTDRKSIRSVISDASAGGFGGCECFPKTSTSIFNSNEMVCKKFIEDFQKTIMEIEKKNCSSNNAAKLDQKNDYQKYITLRKCSCSFYVKS